jgi:hypothetical protein
MIWIVIFVISALAVALWSIQRNSRPVVHLPSLSTHTNDPAPKEWLKFEFEGQPISRITDAYTMYTAKRYKEHCTEKLLSFQEVIQSADGLLTINMKHGLKEVEMRVSGLSEDTVAAIGEVVRQVNPPYEEGELAYRGWARRNARQRYMRSIGRWRS